MNTFTKTLMAGGILAAAGTAQAATISIDFSYDPDAESLFHSMLSGPVVQENFDALPVQGTGMVMGSDDNSSWVDSNNWFDTNVGTFTLTDPGQTNAVDGYPNDEWDLKIESSDTGEHGREVLSDYQGDFWLDSNDAREVEWDFTNGGLTDGSYNAFGFHIADPSDVAASLTLQFADGSYSDQITIPFEQDNAGKGYVTVKSTANIVGGLLTFDNSADNDGWGIDDVTVGNLPEPSTLLLMGIGLLGLGIVRRRVSQ